jgi:hypothetical protein
MAGAEIVERDVKAETAQRFEAPEDLRRGGGRHRLGDLDDELSRGVAGFVQDAVASSRSRRVSTVRRKH